MNEILMDKKEIVGQIYIIKNTLSSKHYVGQTVSHRKNRGKYRPFGYIGRLNDHISEAICNTKKKQCWYLNNAIRKDGKDVWKVELLEVCTVKKLDEREQHYIREYGSIFPNGYNLTLGGKTVQTIAHEFSEPTATPRQKRGGCVFRSQSTRNAMSARSKEFSNTVEVKQLRSQHAKQQHNARKLKIFKGVIIDPTNLQQYITQRKNCVVVRKDHSIVRFAGKHETQGQLMERALEFLTTLATLPNCSGNPLEP
jgi:hypothetical protein